MAGKIIADVIEAPAGRVTLNVGNVTVASINASGFFTSTGNLLIGQANSVSTGAIQDGAVTNDKLSLVANASNIRTALNASGDAPIYACRAWVNFNGTGTVAIRGSGNVSSITDNGAGDYTVNFATAMPDANYSVCGMNSGSSSNADWAILDAGSGGSNPSTTTVRVRATANANVIDTTYCNVIIFR